MYLIDPRKVKLYLPALFVEVCYLFGRRIEVIGNNAKQLTGVDDHADLPDWNLQRILAAVGEPGRQMADAVAGKIGGRGDAVLLHPAERSVLLQPRHEADAVLIECPPSTMIIISEVVRLGCARLAPHR